MVTINQIYTGKISILDQEGHRTGIYKKPVDAPVYVSKLGLTGDEQADKRVHGGPEKAVHQYASENYVILAVHFPEIAKKLQAGSLGENLSSTGITEETACIGDIVRIGGVTLQLSQPRSPCWKINHKFGVATLSKWIHQAYQTGWYYRVLEEGQMAAGDSLTLLERPNPAVTLTYFWSTVLEHRPPTSDLATIIQSTGLAPEWQQRLQQRWAFLTESQ